ncbi:MFS transporter [Synergistales bacterium]|nr:MFS transporter [Synergistales bacterium]
MIFSYLLAVIYLAFIGLGLPDAILGAAWPAMRFDIGAPLSAAGTVSLTICFGTILSSLISGRVIYRFNTGPVTAVSVATTAFALLGMTYSTSLLHLHLFAVPLGVGAGGVDIALNNFVALHYKARHMNWLHSFWGVGAMIGPVFMSAFMRDDSEWRLGYLSITVLLFALTVILFASLPLWGKAKAKPETADARHGAAAPPVTNVQLLRVPGIKYAMIAFFCYCGCELSAGLWAASYLAEIGGLSGAAAAACTSAYYGGITLGRFLCGFASVKLREARLVRIGCCVCVFSIVMFILPLPAAYSAAGLILLGLGCAPFFPAMIHETPSRFGEKNSQSAMGLQMASAYAGLALIPPLLGELSKYFTLSIFPWFLLALTAAMFFFSERITRTVRR